MDVHESHRINRKLDLPTDWLKPINNRIFQLIINQPDRLANRLLLLLGGLAQLWPVKVKAHARLWALCSRVVHVRVRSVRGPCQADNALGQTLSRPVPAQPTSYAVMCSLVEPTYARTAWLTGILSCPTMLWLHAMQAWLGEGTARPQTMLAKPFARSWGPSGCALLHGPTTN